MAKPGIKIVSETVGAGPELKKGDVVRVRFDCCLNKGEQLVRDGEQVWTVGDRSAVAGFRYGIEGMRAGGTRCFRASPHLCYRELGMDKVPKNAVLVFDIKSIEIIRD